MPIIKDKYGAKGDSIRSKFVKREFIDSDAVSSEETFSSRLTTQQKQAEEAKAIKEIIRINESAESLSSNITAQEVRSNLSGVKLADTDADVNIVKNVLTLNKGESLSDIVISAYNATGSASVTTLAWSVYAPSELTFTVDAGTISAVRGGEIYKLLIESIPSGATISLGEGGLFRSFTNVSKTIYFYAVSSVAQIHLTVAKI